MTRDEFIQKVAPSAVADYPISDILPSLVIAQAILESRWGVSGLTLSANNLFGMKGIGSAGFVTMKTTEHVGDNDIKIDARFRKYNNWGESIADHSALLQKPLYKKVKGERDYKKACHAIKDAGYATDRNYTQLLIDIIEKYKLYEFDTVGVEDVDKVKGTVNGTAKEGFLKDGRLFVPAAELLALGVNVEWDNTKKTFKLSRVKA